jgi:hypothetical protein
LANALLHGRGRPKVSVSHATARPRSVLYTVAALSLLAALIHLWVMPEHFEEWWGYGAFFLVAAVAQAVYVPLLLRWPNQSVLLLLGIAGNSAIVLLYLLTRVVGIPLFGPEAGEVEGVGFIDVCATSSEMAIVVALGALLLRLVRERATLIGLVLSATLLVGAHLPHLLLLLLALL